MFERTFLNQSTSKQKKELVDVIVVQLRESTDMEGAESNK
jgi:hypothetical protein